MSGFSWLLFLSILASVESGNNDLAVGDLNKRCHAYTAYQIRQPYLDDANQIAGTNDTMSQLRADRKLAAEKVRDYISRYGVQYIKKTGKPLSMEVAFRIHNGGPRGWRRSSTDEYWERVKREFRRRNMNWEKFSGT